jgi:DNA-binding IscR family transcriptional regulator
MRKKGKHGFSRHSVMQFMHEMGSAVRGGDVTVALGIKPPRVSLIMKQLVEAGFASRVEVRTVKGPKNGYVLTASGVRATVALRDGMPDVVTMMESVEMVDGDRR